MERMPDAQQPGPPRGRATVSMPLGDANIYRPGPLLAVSIIVAPVSLALIIAAFTLNTMGTVPVWLPLVPLLWLPMLPLLWLMLKSVRMSANGLAVGRPWQRWREFPWMDITRAEQRGTSLRITSTDARTMTFTPFLLRDGARLKRQILLRLPAHVLVGALRQKAQHLVMGNIFPKPSGGLSGMLRARPRRRWRYGALLMALAAIAGAVVSLTSRRGGGTLGIGAITTGAVAAAAVCVVVAVAALLAQFWLGQSIFVSEQGIETALPFSARLRAMPWHEVELIEIGPGELLLRLRSYRRVVCPGPRLLRPADRNVMRAFIHEYCVARGVPFVRRRWFF
ncbi:MAG: hypothetical protein IVW57_11385 [Ktedonobacterales bacterium]|nr:hypothetical protein [Ktedonobacterales bacterium]